MKVKINPNVEYIESFKKTIGFYLKQKEVFGYLKQRMRWNWYPQYRIVSKFPTHVDFEASSVCQMKCPMCFQESGQDVDQGMMDLGLFKRAVDEVAQYDVYSIRLSWRGECLLNPGIKEMIEYANAKKIPSISMITNGERIDEDLIDCFIENQVEYLGISIDGLEEDYNIIRKPATFEKIINILKLIKEKKEAASSIYPLIRINTVSYFLQEEEKKNKFLEIFSPLAERILISKTINNFKDIPVDHNPDFTCDFPWQRLFVAWNGNVFPCCNDYTGMYLLGNVENKSLYDIWHGEEIEELRSTLKAKKRMGIKLCAERDCGLDENDNDHNPAFIETLNERIENEKERRKHTS